MAELTEKQVQSKANRQIAQLEKLSASMTELEAALANNEQFQQFLQFEKKFQEKKTELFKNLETQMIDNGVDKIEGPWGSFTIVNRKTYSIEDENKVPEKYKETQVVVDMKAVKSDIEATRKLEGDESFVIKGINEKNTKYLMKRITSFDRLAG